MNLVAADVNPLTFLPSQVYGLLLAPARARVFAFLTPIDAC
jgi:hypothetical protein